MKVSDLNAEALEICCEKTYQHEWPGQKWDRASEKEKATYRKEIAASIISYLVAASNAERPSSPAATDSASVAHGV